MNIVFACPSGQLGGMELRAVEEAKFLLERDQKVDVLSSRFPEFEAYRDLFAAIDVRCTPFDPAPLLTSWRRRHLHRLGAELLSRRVISRMSPGLMHVFFPWTNQGLDQLWLAGRLGIPSMISVHNAFPYTRFSSWHRHHLPVAFRTVRAIYGVSQSALRNFLDIFDEFVPREACRSVVYNFVDMDRFKPTEGKRQVARQHLGIPEDVPVVGSVGRFDDQKKPLSLLSVFHQVKREEPAARLLLVGEGMLLEQVKAMIIELGLSDSVTLLGFQKNIEDIFPAMDVHVLLSRNEGFGIVSAEAMACGVPVVGTRVAGTEEVIAGCPAGRLVPLGNERDAACSILELLALSPSERAVMGNKARSHVAERFSKDIWRQQVTAVYVRALGQPFSGDAAVNA